MVKCDACGKNVESYIKLKNTSKENMDKGKGIVVLCFDCKRRFEEKKS